MIWTSGVSLPPTSLMERLSLGSTRLILMLVISPSGIRWYNLGKTKMDQDGIYLRRPPNAQFQPLFFFLPNFGFSQTKLCIVPHTCFPFSCLRASISFSAWNVFHSRTKPSFFFKACMKWSLQLNSALIHLSLLSLNIPFLIKLSLYFSQHSTFYDYYSCLLLPSPTGL